MNFKPKLLKCKNCGCTFNAPRRKHGNKMRQINRKHCFNCVPEGMSVGSALGSKLIGKECKCVICGCNYIYSKRKIEGRRCTAIKCLKCILKVYRKKRKTDMKLMCMECKGGKCQKCGYNKCFDALIFHHRDPIKKEFNLSFNTHKMSWKRVKKELDKCDLLCNRCHTEVHCIGD